MMVAYPLEVSGCKPYSQLLQNMDVEYNVHLQRNTGLNFVFVRIQVCQ